MQQVRRHNQDTDGAKWKTKVPFVSSVLSSHPSSLQSTAVYMAGLFSLTGFEGHETGGHRGPRPPRQHTPPQSASCCAPQPSLLTKNLLQHFKYFIPQALSRFLFLPFSAIFLSQFFQIFLFVTDISVFAPNTHPITYCCPPVILSRSHICMFLLLGCHGP